MIITEREFAVSSGRSTATPYQISSDPGRGEEVMEAEGEQSKNDIMIARGKGGREVGLQRFR